MCLHESARTGNYEEDRSIEARQRSERPILSELNTAILGKSSNMASEFNSAPKAQRVTQRDVSENLPTYHCKPYLPLELIKVILQNMMRPRNCGVGCSIPANYFLVCRAWCVVATSLIKCTLMSQLSTIPPFNPTMPHWGWQPRRWSEMDKKRFMKALVLEGNFTHGRYSARNILRLLLLVLEHSKIVTTVNLCPERYPVNSPNAKKHVLARIIRRLYAVGTESLVLDLTKEQIGLGYPKSYLSRPRSAYPLAVLATRLRLLRVTAREDQVSYVLPRKWKLECPDLRQVVVHLLPYGHHENYSCTLPDCECGSTSGVGPPARADVELFVRGLQDAYAQGLFPVLKTCLALNARSYYVGGAKRSVGHLRSFVEVADIMHDITYRCPVRHYSTKFDTSCCTRSVFEDSDRSDARRLLYTRDLLDYRTYAKRVVTERIPKIKDIMRDIEESILTFYFDYEPRRHCSGDSTKLNLNVVSDDVPHVSGTKGGEGRSVSQGSQTLDWTIWWLSLSRAISRNLYVESQPCVVTSFWWEMLEDRVLTTFNSFWRLVDADQQKAPSSCPLT